MGNLGKFYCQSGKVQELWYDEKWNIFNQTEPTLIICREKIPVIKCRESFEYLGKTYNFDITCKEVRNKLEDKVTNYLSKTDKLPLHPRYKIMILNRYVFSKLRCTLTAYEFPLTWLKQNLDSSVLYYV